MEVLEQRPEIDYASTILDETYPLGMHVEVFKKTALNKINKMELNDQEKEHVTPAIYRNPNIFKLFSVKNTSKENLFRITVDYPEDLNVIRSVCDHFVRQDFYCEDIVKFLKSNDEIMKLNMQYMKNQKL